MKVLRMDVDTHLDDIRTFLENGAQMLLAHRLSVPRRISSFRFALTAMMSLGEMAHSHSSITLRHLTLLKSLKICIVGSRAAYLSSGDRI